MRGMVGVPVSLTGGLIFFNEDLPAAAGHHRHDEAHPAHTHSFVEIMLVVGGSALHLSSQGSWRVSRGDVVLMRPGAWHAFEHCDEFDVINCCFSAELLRRELAWARNDQLLGYLLWDAPYAQGRGGMFALRLDEASLADVVVHLEAMENLRGASLDLYRGEIIGRLAIVLTGLARAARTARDDLPPRALHPSVIDAIQLLEAQTTHNWTVAELAGQLHLAPNYLNRLFKSMTGLPPMAYLAHHRAERAAVLLLHTSDPVAQIGATVGWPDQNYFARRFRAHYGISPTTYRSRGLRPPGDAPPDGVVAPGR